MGWIVLLLTISVSPIPPGETEGASLLASKLELIKEGKPFLELTGNRIGVFVGGWEVKDFPVTIHQIVIGEGSRVTAVEDVTPLNPPRKVVLDSEVLAQEAQDPTGDVSTLDQIVGVDEMPDTYIVRFDDGGVWMVNFQGWQGFSGAWAKSRVQLQIFGESIRTLFSGDEVDLRFLEMPPDSAREMFWFLEKGTKTLQ